jgi:NhaP-type Na+/H+ or K+/H+ antiporter
LFFFLQLLVGQFLKNVSGMTGIPYTSLITVFGIVVGYYWSDLGPTGVAIEDWSLLTAHEILLIFLPALLFESAFGSDAYTLWKVIGQVLTMAGPIVICSTYLSAYVMYELLGYKGDDFSWEAALLFGAIISATDPVAVVALLKELGASKKLATLIEGESLFNDGTAMVVFLVVLDIVEGNAPSAGEIATKFCRLSLGGLALGLVAGVIVH